MHHMHDDIAKSFTHCWYKLVAPPDGFLGTDGVRV